MLRLFTLLFVLFCSTETYGQWEMTNGPYKSSANLSFDIEKASAHNGIIAGIKDGPEIIDRLVISANDGESWLILKKGFDDFWCYSVAVRDSLVAVGTRWGGVYFSTNYGTSFKPFSSGFSSSDRIDFVAITDSAIIASAIDSPGGDHYTMHYLSLNDTTWLEASGFPQTYMNELSIDNNRLFAATADGLFISSDHGVTWMPTQMTEEIDNVGAYENKIFTGGNDTGDELHFSDDLGETWSVATSNFPNPFVNAFAMFENHTIAATYMDVYSTSNNGNSWYLSSDGLDCSIKHVLHYGNTAVCLCGNSNGPAVSYSGGSSWNHVAGDIALGIKSLESFEGNLITATDHFTYTSLDEGDSWFYDNIVYHEIEATDSLVIASSNSGLRFSFDQGITFNSSIATGLPSPALITEIESKDSLVVLYAQGYGFYLSDDYGYNFEPRFNGIENEEIQCIAFLDSLLFIGTSGSGVFRSDDLGITWTPASFNLPDTTIQVLHIIDNLIFAGTRTNGLFKSVDNGSTWQSVNGLSELDRNITAMHSQDCQIFIGSKGRGVLKSDDCGLTWFLVNNGLINRNVNDFCELNGNLYAGTDGASVWKYALENPETFVNEPAPIFEYSVFPNPTSDFIHVETMNKAYSKVNIYDQIGRLQLSSDYRGEKLAIDLGNLPKGMYIISIEHNGILFNKKVLKL